MPAQVSDLAEARGLQRPDGRSKVFQFVNRRGLHLGECRLGHHRIGRRDDLRPRRRPHLLDSTQLPIRPQPLRLGTTLPGADLHGQAYAG